MMYADRQIQYYVIIFSEWCLLHYSCTVCLTLYKCTKAFIEKYGNMIYLQVLGNCHIYRVCAEKYIL